MSTQAYLRVLSSLILSSVLAPALFGLRPLFKKTTMSVNITGESHPCPGVPYTYSYSTQGTGTVTGQQWSVNGGNLTPGSIFTNQSVQVEWQSNPADLFLTVFYTDQTGFTAVDQKTVTVLTSPNTSAPAIVGATSTNPNYIPPNTPATFAITPISNAATYNWTFPPCFTPSAATTTGPQATVSTTGACSGTVCVKGYNSCSFYSPQTCLTITRVPTLAPITGDAVFCKTKSKAYSIAPIAGIISYTWTFPPGWILNSTNTSGTATLLASSGGHSVTLSVPPSLPFPITGTISVYGTLSTSVNTNTQSKTITVEGGLPTLSPKFSPTITVTSTINTSKKNISVTLPKTSYAFSWSCRVSGSGVTNVHTGYKTGPITFLMRDKDFLSIDLYTSNSCGNTFGSSYTFQLVNGAMIPKDVQ